MFILRPIFTKLLKIRNRGCFMKMPTSLESDILHAPRELQEAACFSVESSIF